MFLRSAIVASAALLFAALTASPGSATTWYVATNGSNTSPATYDVATPCAFIALALNNIAPGDTIFCITPPQPKGFTITKSVTIDCSSARAPVRDVSVMAGSAFVGVSINIAVNANDPFRTVRLRGLDIDGCCSGSGHLFDRGVDIQGATAVYIEDCVISNAAAQGVLDHRTGGQTKLFIKDTIISGNGGAGIVAVSAATGFTVLDNVTSANNTYGIAVGAGNNVTINRSNFSGNSVVGIEGDNGAHLVISASTVSQNNVGIQSSSSVRIYNNDISYNNTGIQRPGCHDGPQPLLRQRVAGHHAGSSRWRASRHRAVSSQAHMLHGCQSPYANVRVTG